MLRIGNFLKKSILFFPLRFQNNFVNEPQIKKKKLKKLLNMAVKTKIIWYRLGHDECLMFQTRHSQFCQFQKDLHSLFYHKLAGVKYDQNVQSVKSPDTKAKKN